MNAVMSSADSAIASTRGDSAHAMTAGRSAHAGTRGERAHAMTASQYARAQTTGERAHAMTAGYSSYAEARGNMSHAMTAGDDTHATATGARSFAVSVGNYSAATAGAYSAAVALGRHNLARARIGGWIVLAEYDRVGNIVDIRSARIDGEKLKPGVYYRLEGGEFVESSYPPGGGRYGEPGRANLAIAD